MTRLIRLDGDEWGRLEMGEDKEHVLRLNQIFPFIYLD